MTNFYDVFCFSCRATRACGSWGTNGGRCDTSLRLPEGQISRARCAKRHGDVCRKSANASQIILLEYKRFSERWGRRGQLDFVRRNMLLRLRMLVRSNEYYDYETLEEAATGTKEECWSVGRYHLLFERFFRDWFISCRGVRTHAYGFHRWSFGHER